MTKFRAAASNEVTFKSFAMLGAEREEGTKSREGSKDLDIETEKGAILACLGTREEKSLDGGQYAYLDTTRGSSLDICRFATILAI